MELKGKKILIVGAGKSGIAAAELLDKKGIAYALYDGNEKLSIETIRDKSPALQDCEIFLGTLKKEVLDTTNVVVLSPGLL